MKSSRKFILILLIFLFPLVGCTKEKSNPIILKDSDKPKEEQKFSYSIGDINLSKSYQNLEPYVEILERDKSIELLVSTGLIRSSDIDIDNVKREGNLVKIYIKSSSDEENKQLVVPKISMNLYGIDNRDIDNLSFEIINTNYDIYKLKYGINETISKLESEFNITSVSYPRTELILKDENVLWDIEFNNVFNNDYKNSPVVDLTAKVNANTGEIVESDLESISNYIDNGEILDYFDNKYILYKKTLEDKDSLYLYDIREDLHKKLYISSSNITEANINKDNQKVYIIEEYNEDKELSILCLEDLTIYKALLTSDFSPDLVEWKDKEHLYILNTSGDKTNVYEYNIFDDNSLLIKTVDQKFTSFKKYREHYLLGIQSEDDKDAEFFITQDFKSELRNIKGFNPKFINNNKIGYLSFSKETGNHNLIIYSLKEDRILNEINLNITNFFPIDNKNLAVIEKKDTDRNFSFYNYNINSHELEFIINTMSDNMYYNQDKNLLYVNLNMPHKEEVDKIILSLKLSELYDN